MSEKTKHQHYVPQSYLMRFTDQKNMLYVFDKTQPGKEPFPTSPRNVAGARYFYDIEAKDFDNLPDDFYEQTAEKMFSELEALLKVQIDNIIARFTLTENPYRQTVLSPPEREAFAGQLTMQIIRTADFRDHVISAFNTLTQTHFDLFAAHRLENYVPGDVKVGIDPNHEKYEHLRMLSNEEFISTLILGLLQNFYWSIGVNRTDQPFYTSDNPVVKRGYKDGKGLVSHQGLLSPGMEIAFPLNSKLILILYEKSYFPQMKDNDNLFMPLDDLDYVTYYNSLQAYQSNKQIYCKEPKFDLLMKMAASEPDFMKKREHQMHVDAPLLEHYRKRRNKKRRK
ncbi:DUF4238 domain-containing protein [Cohnella sp. GbtcB17]|uniref:DUF4238 domain-containing protein n=1 Tax=Cohnella sp. GbtcB17 TaxID=2824762 RepID=UPI001C309BE2